MYSWVLPILPYMENQELFNQWTQFEEFPRFMEGVKSVRQLDNKRLHWQTVIAGKEEDFDAIIDEQIPDQRIAWHSTIGPKQGGVVTFHRLADNKTRIMLQMEYDPQGFVEKAGDMLEPDHQRRGKIDSRNQNQGEMREHRHIGCFRRRGAAAPLRDRRVARRNPALEHK